MDVKKIGRIRVGGGWRAHGPRDGPDGVHETQPVGFDYVDSLVDDHSRLAYSEVLGDEKGATCAAFLARAAAWMLAAGVPRIQRVMTDNHWSYKRSHDVAAVLADLGARQILIRPHCPWQNGRRDHPMPVHSGTRPWPVGLSGMVAVVVDDLPCLVVVRAGRCGSWWWRRTIR